MAALVHILQFIVYPQKTRVTTFTLVSIPVRILHTIYGVWNLDFFRTVILPEVVCLEMSTIQLIVLALEYLVALYPLVLMIQLHARNFWSLVWVWKPASLIVVLEGSGTSNHLSLKPLPAFSFCLLARC